MKKIIAILLLFSLISLNLFGCATLPTETEPQYLTESEAREQLMNCAKDMVVDTIGLSSYTYNYSFNTFNPAVYEAELGYWYFEVDGSVRSGTSKMTLITYEFDAKVDHLSGEVELGELTIWDHWGMLD